MQLNASVERFSCGSTGFLDLTGQYVALGEIREGKRPPLDLVRPELVQAVVQRRDGDGWKLEPGGTESAMPRQPPEIKRQGPGPGLLILPDCLLRSSEGGHCLGGVTCLRLDAGFKDSKPGLDHRRNLLRQKALGLLHRGERLLAVAPHDRPVAHAAEGVGSQGILPCLLGVGNGMSVVAVEGRVVPQVEGQTAGKGRRLVNRGCHPCPSGFGSGRANEAHEDAQVRLHRFEQRGRRHGGGESAVAIGDRDEIV